VLIPFFYSSAFTAKMIAGMASERAIFQSFIEGTDVIPHSSWPSTEYEGRLAVLGYSDVGIGRTRETSAPANLKISRANSSQVACPVLVQ
jgi:hypothetical protein